MSESVLGDYAGLCRRAVEALVASADEAELPDPKARWQRGGAHACRGAVERLAIAYFDPDSPRRDEEALWPRLTQAVDALAAFQHNDGLIDLWESNFHSPPDAAFMVDELVPLYEVLRDHAEPSERLSELLGRLEGVIVAACEGIARGGVHTPNHRWKVASALTLADRLWPHESWRTEAQGYLDEGIDIDADGEFTERSTGGYNYVCDRALILIGRTLGRDEYLDCADRNLEHMLYLLHPDGTLVTNYSLRQDRDQAAGIERHLLLYWYRSLMRGDGRFLSAGELGLRRMGDGRRRLAHLAKWLRYFREAGERPVPAAEPLPADYERRFDGVGVLRRRSGTQSLTLMAGSADVLAIRFGAGPEVGLRIAAGFAPYGQFRAEGIDGAGRRYSLRSHHRCEYYGPGPDTLPGGDWRSREGFKRRVFVSTELTMSLEVACEDDALSLRLRTEGCSRVPIEVALVIRLAEGIEPTGEVETDEATGKGFLNSGELVVRGGEHVLRIGPGSAEHDLTQISCGEAFRRPDVYCIRLVTPVDATLTIRAEQR